MMLVEKGHRWRCWPWTPAAPAAAAASWPTKPAWNGSPLQAGGLHPPVALRRHTGRRGPHDPGDPAGLRGRRVRCGDRGNGRRGTVGNHGGLHGGFFPGPHAGRRRRRAAGHQKGVLELADAVAINKADGDNMEKAEKARDPMRWPCICSTRQRPPGQPPVLTCSALTLAGVDTLWETIQDHRRRCQATGEFDENVAARPWPGCGPDRGRTQGAVFGNPKSVKARLRYQRSIVERGDLSPTVAPMNASFFA
jgi:hypothetical protein